MTTLVTGARGALGRVLSAWLLEHSDGSAVLSSRSPAQADDCLTCDVTDGYAVRNLLRHVRPRVVYHLAGAFSNQFEVDCATNAFGARNLFEAMREEALDARIVVMGSAAEYGVIVPTDNPVAEDRVLRPVSIYGVTKAMQTQIAGYYAHQHSVDVVIARMFNLFAPGLSDRLFVGRVERLIGQYRRGEVDTIDVGNLDSQRDYVSVEDAVTQISQIAARGRSGEIYHVASGRPTAVREVLNRMLDAAGVPVSAVREHRPDREAVGYDSPLIYADTRRTLALR
jgi:nucleoside-diphosphate-sugar epimerase